MVRPRDAGVNRTGGRYDGAMRATAVGPSRAGWLAAAVATLCAIGGARADEWYFSWVCAGACAPDRLDVRGTDGPFGSSDDCERARTDRRVAINRDGSAGSADECYARGGGGAGGGAAGTIVRAAVFARLHRAAVYGGPWSIEYANGTTTIVGPTTGAELAFVFGRQGLGLDATVGLVRAPGARELETDPFDPIWAVWLSLGVASSPFAIVRRPGLEVRPDFAIEVGSLQRVSCERCEFSIARKQEADSAFMWRLRAGVDVWLRGRRNTGVAIEAIYQDGEMGEGDLSDPTSGLSAKLTPPTWMLRLSFIRRGARYSAY
jgi:hypothetical protein